jgi:hypothetical protein
LFLPFCHFPTSKKHLLHQALLAQVFSRANQLASGVVKGRLCVSRERPVAEYVRTDEEKEAGVVPKTERTKHNLVAEVEYGQGLLLGVSKLKIFHKIEL